MNYVRGDYGDQERLRKRMSQTVEEIDLVYATVPQTGFADLIFDIQANNLPPSDSMLRGAVEFGVRRVVLISSGSDIYGVARLLPVNEEHSTNSNSLFGITKLAIEKYGLMFHRLTEL